MSRGLTGKIKTSQYASSICAGINSFFINSGRGAKQIPLSFRLPADHAELPNYPLGNFVNKFKTNDKYWHSYRKYILANSRIKDLKVCLYPKEKMERTCSVDEANAAVRSGGRKFHASTDRLWYIKSICLAINIYRETNGVVISSSFRLPDGEDGSTGSTDCVDNDSDHHSAGANSSTEQSLSLYPDYMKAFALGEFVSKYVSKPTFWKSYRANLRANSCIEELRVEEDDGTAARGAPEELFLKRICEGINVYHSMINSKHIPLDYRVPDAGAACASGGRAVALSHDNDSSNCDSESDSDSKAQTITVNSAMAAAAAVVPPSFPTELQHFPLGVFVDEFQRGGGICGGIYPTPSSKRLFVQANSKIEELKVQAPIPGSTTTTGSVSNSNSSSSIIGSDWKDMSSSEAQTHAVNWASLSTDQVVELFSIYKQLNGDCFMSPSFCIQPLTTQQQTQGGEADSTTTTGKGMNTNTSLDTPKLLYYPRYSWGLRLGYRAQMLLKAHQLEEQGSLTILGTTKRHSRRWIDQRAWYSILFKKLREQDLIPASMEEYQQRKIVLLGDCVRAYYKYHGIGAHSSNNHNSHDSDSNSSDSDSDIGDYGGSGDNEEEDDDGGGSIYGASLSGSDADGESISHVVKAVVPQMPLPLPLPLCFADGKDTAATVTTSSSSSVAAVSSLGLPTLPTEDGPQYPRCCQGLQIGHYVRRARLSEEMGIIASKLRTDAVGAAVVTGPAGASTGATAMDEAAMGARLSEYLKKEGLW